MRTLRLCLAFLVASSFLSCSTTYISYPHGMGVMGQTMTWDVSAGGGDFGPSDEAVPFIHPEVVRHLIAQDESNIANYYRVVLRSAFAGSALASKDMLEISQTFDQIRTREETAALSRIADGDGSEADYVLVSRGFARSVGHLVAPAIVQSIAENGYGRLKWGHLVTEEFDDLKFAMNAVYITANSKTRQIRLHAPAPHSTFTTLNATTFDFVGADDEVVLIPHTPDGEAIPLDGTVSYSDICARVRSLTDQDWTNIKRMN